MKLKQKIKKLKSDRKKLVMVICLLIIVTAAVSSGLYFFSKNKKAEQMHFERQVVGTVKNEVSFPTPVWLIIEKDFEHMNLKKEGGEGGEGGQRGDGAEGRKSGSRVMQKELDALMKKHPPIEEFPFKVLLIEKNIGVLGDHHWELEFPVGGGTLDLAFYVSERPKGSFFLKTEWDKKEWPPEKTKIYFLSSSKEREVMEKSFSQGPKKIKLGMGCDHAYDLTDYWKKTMKSEGLFLNTTHDRHISLLAGTYYFTVFKDEKIYVAELKVLDSRHRDLLCVH